MTLANDPRAPKRFADTSGFFWQHLFLFQAQAGDAKGAEESLQHFFPSLDASVANLPPDAPQRRIYGIVRQLIGGQLKFYLDNPQAAWKDETAVIAKLDLISADLQQA